MVSLKKQQKANYKKLRWKNQGDTTIADNPQEVVTESNHNSTYISDLVTVLRSVVQIPENYQELTWKLLSSFPKGFQIADIVANTYRLYREKVVGAVIRLSLNRLNPRQQNIFNIFRELLKIRTSS